MNVAQKKTTPEEALEEARKKLVNAMKNGHTLVVSMQQGAPSFSDWFNAEESFPALSVFTDGGLALADNDKDGPNWPTKLFKDGEKESGIAVAREGFNVVLTSWFEADEFEEFLFDEGMGMNSFPKDLFEFIIVKKS